MLFKKKDLAQKLIEIARADQKSYDALRAKFLSLKPKWDALQGECERLCAARLSQDSSYRRAVSEEFWAARAGELERELEAVTVKRDTLTADITVALQSLKDKISHRLSSVSGSFGNWVGAVCGRLSEDSPLYRDLIAARKQCEALKDMGELVSLILTHVERIEDMESVDNPSFKMDAVTARALEISEPADTAVRV